MGVSSTTNRVSYTGDGVSTIFNFGYLFLENSNLKVYVTDLSGVITLKTYTTDYTVAGAGGTSGAITFLAAPTSGFTVTIVREMPNTQLFTLQNNGALDVCGVICTFDRLTLSVQKNTDTINRGLFVCNGYTPACGWNGGFVPSPGAALVISCDCTQICMGPTVTTIGQACACAAVSAACAAVSASCAAVSASCAAVSASCVALAAGCATVSAACATLSASCAGVSASCAGVSASCSTLSASCAGVSSSCASLSAGCAVVSSSCASLSSGCAGVSSSCASLSSGCAGVSSSCASLSSGCAGVSALCAGVSATCANVSAGCATLSSSCASLSSSCAGLSSSCATLSGSCAGVSAGCAGVSSSCASLSAGCAGVSASCAALSSSCAALSSACVALLVGSATDAPTVSTFMCRDAQANTRVNNITTNYLAIATAAGTTTFTNACPAQVTFTGVTTQTLKFPNATTLPKGWVYKVINASSGVLTVQDTGANVLQSMVAAAFADFVLEDNSTANGTWRVKYVPANALGTVTSVGLASDTSASSILLYGNTPITTSGSMCIGFCTQAASTVLAGPTSGAAAAPTFRALTINDLSNRIVNITFACSPVTLAAADKGKIFLTDTSGGIVQYNYPAPAAGIYFEIRDSAGCTPVNGICFHRNGSEKFQKVAADYLIRAPFWSGRVATDATDWSW